VQIPPGARPSSETAADLREFTLPAASGGELGRRVAQIDDVAVHLDTLLAIAPICEYAFYYDWLIHPLLDLCRNERTAVAHEELVHRRGTKGRMGLRRPESGIRSRILKKPSFFILGIGWA
jgi:hypothetical protein